MSAFSETELAYLTGERRLGRIATVGRDGMPHVAPVGWSYNAELGTIDIGGSDFARTKKFLDVARTGRAAIVIDDVLPPWRPRGIEVRGDAEAVDQPEAHSANRQIRYVQRDLHLPLRQRSNRGDMGSRRRLVADATARPHSGLAKPRRRGNINCSATPSAAECGRGRPRWLGLVG